MSKRVYEIARELDLSTREAVDRLNNAGIEIKSHLASVEDPVYKRVFDNSSNVTPSNGHSEVRESQALPSMIQLPLKRSLSMSILVFAGAFLLAFTVGASVGAIAVLMSKGDLYVPAREAPKPAGEKVQVPEHRGADAGRSEQQQANANQEQAASTKREQAEYVSRIGEIQAKSVETFLDSHSKMLRYDALTADEVGEMQVNSTVLATFATQTDYLDPPEEYREQYEVFSRSVYELNEATRLGYSLAADPIGATQADFDEYDHLVSEVAADLQRSNELLDRDYKTIEGLQRVSPS